MPSLQIIAENFAHWLPYSIIRTFYGYFNDPLCRNILSSKRVIPRIARIFCYCLAFLHSLPFIVKEMHSPTYATLAFSELWYSSSFSVSPPDFAWIFFLFRSSTSNDTRKLDNSLSYQGIRRNIDCAVLFIVTAKPWQGLLGTFFITPFRETLFRTSSFPTSFSKLASNSSRSKKPS